MTSDAEKIRIVNEWKEAKKQHDVVKQCPFYFNEPWGDQIAFRNSGAQIRLLIGGNRCLGAEQLIYDPVLREHRRVDEIDGPHHVYAWSEELSRVVVAAAERPFKKGPAETIYEITFSNGRTLHASGGHLVLDATSSYVPVSSLRTGSGLFLPPSSSEPDPSVRGVGVQRSMRTTRGSRSGCQTSCRSCGGRLRSSVARGQGDRPSRVGVLGRIRSFLRWGGSDPKLGCSPACPCSCHPSIPDGLDLTLDQFVEFSGQGVSRASEPYALASPSTLLSYAASPSSLRSGTEGARLLSCSDSALVATDTSLCLVVANVRAVRVDFKWDFTVPVFHNYLAGGVVNHNTGKTTEGTIEAISRAVGFRPDGSRMNLRKPPTQGAVVVKDQEKIDLVILKKLRSFVPASWYEVRASRTGGPPVVHWKNGSRWHFGTFQQDVDSKEGPDWDWVWGDEPMPRAMWIAYRRGLLDRKGGAFFTFTPLNCPWIYQELYMQADGVRISNFHLDLMDNPHIDHNEKLSFIADIHPDEREARIHGKFSHLVGAVFPEFRRSVHVIGAHSPPYGAPIFMVMDPHDRRPSYIFWCYVDKRDRIVIYDEWPNDPFWEMKTTRMSVRDYSTLIRDKEGSRFRDVVERLIDPNFGRTKSHMTGTTLIEEYQEYDLDFYGDLENDIALGHHRIHERLNHENRDPGILVTENCSNMIWAFENYIWRTKDIAGEFNSKERPGETGKDQIDAVRYLLSYDPKHSMGETDSGEDQPFDEKDYGHGYG